MTSWHSNVFRCCVTLCWESSGHCVVDSPYKRPVMQTTEYFFVVHLKKCWINDLVSGDLWCLNGHVTSL